MRGVSTPHSRLQPPHESRAPAVACRPSAPTTRTWYQRATGGGAESVAPAAAAAASSSSSSSAPLAAAAAAPAQLSIAPAVRSAPANSGWASAVRNASTLCARCCSAEWRAGHGLGSVQIRQRRATSRSPSAAEGGPTPLCASSEAAPTTARCSSSSSSARCIAAPPLDSASPRSPRQCTSVWRCTRASARRRRRLASAQRWLASSAAWPTSAESARSRWCASRTSRSIEQSVAPPSTSA
jgi:hypothetical protein